VQVTTPAAAQQQDQQPEGVGPQTKPADAPAASTASQPATQPSSPAARRRDDLAADLYALVVFLHKNCNADLFEAMGVLDLTITQIKLLHQLEGATRELTLKEAAGLVPVSLPAASRTVDDLVRRGMIERHEDVEDRRMKRIRLTDVGRAVIAKLNAARLSGLEQFTETLNDDERRLLAGALAKLLQRDDVAVCRPEGI
jgi:DNA-binding MarR family transcriptional regulator